MRSALLRLDALTHRDVEFSCRRVWLRRNKLFQHKIPKRARDGEHAHHTLPHDEPTRRLYSRALNDVRSLMILLSVGAGGEQRVGRGCVRCERCQIQRAAHRAGRKRSDEMHTRARAH